MEILPHLGEAEHRLAHPASQHVKGDELADGKIALDDKLGAKIQN